MPKLRWSYLGRVDYDAARALQTSLAAERAGGGCDDLLLLLEHPAVLTIGRNSAPPAHAAARVVRTDRGGSLTYHGPGQLVGYPVVALRAAGRGVRGFVASLEAALCDTAAACGVRAHVRQGFPGVWSGAPGAERKLASIGLAVRRGVTLHGCALNLDQRARAGFAGFDPCGLPGVRVTSLACEGAHEVRPERVGRLLADALAHRLALEPVEHDPHDSPFAPVPEPELALARGSRADLHGHRPPP